MRPLLASPCISHSPTRHKTFSTAKAAPLPFFTSRSISAHQPQDRGRVSHSDHGVTPQRPVRASRHKPTRGDPQFCVFVNASKRATAPTCSLFGLLAIVRKGCPLEKTEQALPRERQEELHCVRKWHSVRLVAPGYEETQAPSAELFL